MTVRFAVALRVPDLAVTVVGVDAGVTARALSHTRFPLTPVTVAMAVFAVDHTTTPVMSREVPLLKEPVAVMRVRVFLTRKGLAGEMTMSVRFPPVTLRFAVPLIPPRVALIEVVPCKRVVAAPEAAIVAISGLDEVQAARLVMSPVVPSE